MKKLVIVNHLGEIIHERDVYLEGENVDWRWSTPTPVWLGSIHVYDMEDYERLRVSLVEYQPLIIAPEPEPVIEEPGITLDEIASFRQICREEDELNDAKAIGDKGIGNKGASKAKQLEGVEEPSEKPTSRKAHSRNKRVRST